MFLHARRQDLDSHLTVQADLSAPIHRAHAATAKERGDFIFREQRLQRPRLRRLPESRIGNKLRDILLQRAVQEITGGIAEERVRGGGSGKGGHREERGENAAESEGRRCRRIVLVLLLEFVLDSGRQRRRR